MWLALGHQMDTHSSVTMSVCSSCIWYYSWTHRPHQDTVFSTYQRLTVNSHLWYKPVGTVLMVMTEDLWLLPVHFVVWFQQQEGSWGPGRIAWLLSAGTALMDTGNIWRSTCAHTYCIKGIPVPCGTFYVFGSLRVKSKVKQLYSLSGCLFAAFALHHCVALRINFL